MATRETYLLVTPSPVLLGHFSHCRMLPMRAPYGRRQARGWMARGASPQAYPYMACKVLKLAPNI